MRELNLNFSESMHKSNNLDVARHKSNAVT